MMLPILPGSVSSVPETLANPTSRHLMCRNDVPRHTLLATNQHKRCVLRSSKHSVTVPCRGGPARSRVHEQSTLSTPGQHERALCRWHLP